VNVMARRTYYEFSRFGKPTNPPDGSLSICSKDEPARTAATAEGSRTVQLAGGAASLLHSRNGAALTTVPLGEPNAAARDVTFSADGRHVILIAEPNGDATGKIMLVYDADSGGLVDRKQFAFGEGSQCVRMSPDGRHAAVVNDANFRIVDFESGSIVHDYGFNNRNFRLLGVAFSPAGDRLVTYGVDGTLAMMDVASAGFLDRSALAALRGGDPMPFGFDRSGKQVLIVRPDQEYGWSIFSTVGDLIGAARAYVPNCIAPDERASLYLPPEPPDWCIDLAKPPYHTDDWKQWRAARKAGQNLPMPGAAVRALQKTQ
jgi:hypothetical protein